MRKKLIAALLASAMVLSLTACGGNGESVDAGTSTEDVSAENSGEVPAENSEEVSAEENGDKVLTAWCWDPNFNIYALEKAAEIYARDNEGFQVDVVEMKSEDIETKITTAVSAGDLSTLPDIFLMQDNSIQKYAANYPDVFADLTNSGIDFTQFSQAKAAYSVLDGKNLGIPFDNGAVINCVRTDYLEQAGYTVDDFTDISWSDFMEKAKVVKEKTGQPMITAQAGMPDQVMMMLQSCGSSLFNEDGTVNIAGNATLKECLEVYAQMVADGTLVEVIDWDQYVASINNGTVAGAMTGCWIMATVTNKEDQSGKWAVTNMPKLDKAEGAANYSSNGGSSWIITSNCKNQELAADFFNKTFAGSTELYDDLISKGALSTWAPAGETEVYKQEVAFFGNDAVYSKIVDFATKTPSNTTGAFYYDARDAVGVALSNITQQKADIDAEMENAQAAVEFSMGN